MTDLPKWGACRRHEKAEAIVQVLRRSVPGIDGRNWVDIGCGNGEIAGHLASRGARTVVGVDPETWPAWSVLRARHSNLSLLEGLFDQAQIPLPEASADVVVCNQVYEHVGDPRRLIQNIQRVLVPGGVCYFAGPNLLWPIEPHVYWPFVHWLPRRLAKMVMSWLGSSKASELDAYSMDCWTLRRWFRSAGLEVRSVMRDRIAVELALRGRPRLSRLVASVPPLVFRVLEPLSPGFVYLLSRPSKANGGVKRG